MLRSVHLILDTGKYESNIEKDLEENIGLSRINFSVGAARGFKFHNDNNNKIIIIIIIIIIIKLSSLESVETYIILRC
jgi:hypothetical protein